LYDLLRCPHRVALDAFGDPALRDEDNPFVRLLWERGTLYEREVIARLKQPFLDLSSLGAREKEQQTLEAIGRGEPLIAPASAPMIFWECPIFCARYRMGTSPATSKRRRLKKGQGKTVRGG
jgi:hypothetical protein